MADDLITVKKEIDADYFVYDQSHFISMRVAMLTPLDLVKLRAVYDTEIERHFSSKSLLWKALFQEIARGKDNVLVEFPEDYGDGEFYVVSHRGSGYAIDLRDVRPAPPKLSNMNGQAILGPSCELRFSFEVIHACQEDHAEYPREYGRKYEIIVPEALESNFQPDAFLLWLKSQAAKKQARKLLDAANQMEKMVKEFPEQKKALRELFTKILAEDESAPDAS